MARARAAEHSASGHGLGGAAVVAPPTPDPLKLVQAAVGGEDLLGVTRLTADACGRAVSVTLPSHGAPVLWPETAAHPELLSGLLDYADALAADRRAALPDGVIDAVAVKLGPEVVGIVAALGPGPAEIAVRPWLEAAAAAAAVTTLMRDSGTIDVAGARRSFLEGLELHPPADIAGLLTHGRRLGADLNHGAIGLCALSPSGFSGDALPAGVLFAEVGANRLLGLVPLAADADAGLTSALVEELRGTGAVAACSAPRNSPELLQEALLEAAILAELAAETERRAISFAQEETYRLLVGVLLRAPDELARLRAQTVAELERYDALHDTELLATLQAFLAHHGSTTETADAMSLHRHTVGYRLARVQEVSGLSPYESDGRERLSLGLKADRILGAEGRRLARARQA